MARVGAGHNSRIKRGYDFQFSLTKIILAKLKRFRSVTTRKMNGDVVTVDSVDRMGRDGGLDMIIEIEGKSRKSVLSTARGVKKALKSVGQ